MAKTVLIFNAIVFLYFGFEFASYYLANNFGSDFATAFIVHDSFMPMLIAIMNSIVIIGQIFEFKDKTLKGSK